MLQTIRIVKNGEVILEKTFPKGLVISDADTKEIVFELNDLLSASVVNSQEIEFVVKESESRPKEAKRKMEVAVQTKKDLKMEAALQINEHLINSILKIEESVGCDIEDYARRCHQHLYESVELYMQELKDKIDKLKGDKKNEKELIKLCDEWRYQRDYLQMMKEYPNDGKLNAILAAMPLPDPTDHDIRHVRAVDKRIIKSFSFMPMVLYAETMEYRNYHRMFENTFSEPMTRFDADYGRASLVGRAKKKY